MFHDQQIPNVEQGRGAGDVIALRDWTEAQRLLRRLGIQQRDIAELAGLPVSTVCRALNIKVFGRVRYRDVARMRLAAEILLLGKDVPPHRVAELWRPYDAEVTRLIATEPEPPKAA